MPILDEVAVRDALTAPGKNSVFRRDLVFRNRKTFAGEIEKSLIGVCSGFTDVGRAATEEIKGAAAIRSLIGVPRDDGSDRPERDAQFVGNDLAIRGERCALTKVTLPGPNQDSVVRMNFDPGIKLSRIERVSEGRSGDFRALEALSSENRRTNECDAHNECATGFDELTAGESCCVIFDGFFCGGSCHGLLPLSHKRRGVFYSVHDGDIAAAATRVR